MDQTFFSRLVEYYKKVAEVLKGEAEAAAIFPNSSDKGITRENIYAQFLKQHAPSKCNVFFGGFLFDQDGNESKQMDVIISTDTTPRFDLFNQGVNGKSFCPVEGTLGVASIKSTLDKKELYDALDGIASIPQMKLNDGRTIYRDRIKDYDDWPFKIIYASNGIKGTTIYEHLINYYNENPNILASRMPNIIHVAGEYLIMRAARGMQLFNFETRKKSMTISLPLKSFRLITFDSDIQAIMWTILKLQQNALESTQIRFSYHWIINNINKQLFEKMEDENTQPPDIEP